MKVKPFCYLFSIIKEKVFVLYIQTIMYQNINPEKRKGFEIILAYIIISLNF
jgi:hypothetical protein